MLKPTHSSQTDITRRAISPGHGDVSWAQNFSHSDKKPKRVGRQKPSLVSGRDSSGSKSSPSSRTTPQAIQ